MPSGRRLSPAPFPAGPQAPWTSYQGAAGGRVTGINGVSFTTQPTVSFLEIVSKPGSGFCLSGLIIPGARFSSQSGTTSHGSLQFHKMDFQLWRTERKSSEIERAEELHTDNEHSQSTLRELSS